MKTMTRSQLVDLIVSEYLAQPLTMHNGQSALTQMAGVGNVRGPINWTPSTEQVLAKAAELGVIAVED